MALLLDVVTTVCVGLLIGTEFAVSAFINPILWQLEEGAQSRSIALFARRLGTAMPFWYGAAFLLLVGEAVMRRGSGGRVLLSVAVVLWAAVIVLTLAFLVPINNRMARLDGVALPEAARREHRRWDGLHRLRVATLTAAMICFLIAVRC